MLNENKFDPCLKTRIAPTPSGYLHLGNIYNFLLIRLITELTGGQIHLRIDDHDTDRFRIDYVEDIFEQLHWLDIKWQSGPVDVDDFMKNYRSIRKMSYYHNQFLDFQLECFDHLYVCQCSRSELERTKENPCRKLKLKYETNQTTIRYFDEQHGIDVVLWRKENLASYQWMSLCEDVDQGINFIVRGEDLYESSIMQKNIAQNFARFHSFESCQIFHHALIKSNTNEKLSKSQKASPIYLARQTGLNRELVFEQFSNWLGLSPTSNWTEICRQYLPHLSTLPII